MRVRSAFIQQTAALSLLETAVGLWLGTMIGLAALRVLMFLSTGWTSSVAALQTDASWSQIVRVMAEDVHASTSVTPLPSGVTISTANGGVFRYTVNGLQQMVRVRVGGGTSVVAEGVKSMQVTGETVAGSTVEDLTVVLEDGQTRTFTFSGLEAYTP